MGMQIDPAKMESSAFRYRRGMQHGGGMSSPGGPQSMNVNGLMGGTPKAGTGLSGPDARRWGSMSQHKAYRAMGGLGFGGRGQAHTHASPPRFMGPEIMRGGVHLRGLSEEAETILTTDDPVGMYVKALQTMFYGGSVKPDLITGRWDFATHQAMTKWVGTIDEPDDEKDMPSWGTAPSFTAKFAVDMALFAMKFDEGVRVASVLLETIGAPTTNSYDVLVFFKGVGTGSPTWLRSMQIFDAIERYIIGAEGGRAYGDPDVKTRGIVSAAGAAVLSVAAILIA